MDELLEPPEATPLVHTRIMKLSLATRSDSHFETGCRVRWRTQRNSKIRSRFAGARARLTRTPVSELDGPYYD